MNEEMQQEIISTLLRLKKKRIKSIIAIVIFLGVLAVFLYDAKEFIIQDAIDYNDLASYEDKSDAIGKYVDINGLSLVGCYAESGYTVKTSTILKGYHYVFMLEDSSIISVKVSDDDTIAMLNKGVDQYWAYCTEQSDITPEIISLRGKVKKLDPKLEEEYDEIMDRLGYEEDVEINLIDVDASYTWSRVIIFSVVCLGLALSWIIYLVVIKHKMKETGEAIMNYASAVSVSYEM